MNSPKNLGNSSYAAAAESRLRRQNDASSQASNESDLVAPEIRPRRRSAVPPARVSDVPDLVAPEIRPRRRSAVPPSRASDVPDVVAPEIRPRRRSAVPPARASDVPELTAPAIPPRRPAAVVMSPAQVPALPEPPNLSRGKRAHPTIRTIPAPLVCRAWNQRESRFFAFDALLNNVFDVRALAAYGVLGTLRLLRKRKGLARENHSRYAWQTLLKNVDALLPSAADCGSSKGDAQTVLDACGAFARDVAAYASITDLLNIEPNEASVAFDLRLWVEHLQALQARDARGQWVAAQMLLGFKEAVELRLCGLQRREQQLAKERFAATKSLRMLTDGVAQLSAAVSKDRYALRFAALNQNIRDASPLAPTRAPNAALPWPSQVAGVEADPALLERIFKKVQARVPMTDAEIRDFLQQVFALPQTLSKAHCMSELGRMYAQLDTQRDLQESLHCFDQTLIILQACSNGADASAHRNALRRCYDDRGKASLQLASRVLKIGGFEYARRAARAHRDAAVRDFAAAYLLTGCTEPNDAANYVASTARVKKRDVGDGEADVGAQYAELHNICSADENFSDGHYQRFWRAIAAFELDSARVWDPVSRSFKRGSQKAVAKKICAIEEAIAAFAAAELAALYQHQCAQRTALKQRDAVHKVAGYATAVEHVTRLHVTAADLYSQAKDSPSRAAAVLHLCHALQHTRWLIRRCRSQLDPIGKPPASATTRALLHKDMARLRRQELDVLRRKATLYGHLRLWSCQAKELETALRVARSQGWQARLSRLHMRLFAAYRCQGKLDAAKAQLDAAAAAPKAACHRGSWLSRAYLALGRAYLKQGCVDAATAQFEHAATLPRANDNVQRACREALQSIASGEVPPPVATPAPDDPQALLAFQDQQILAECLQVLDDNERACGSTTGLVWQEFVEALLAAPDIKTWCDLILGQVRLNAKDEVTPAQALRLVNLSNMEATFADPRKLQALQNCVIDAPTALRSRKLRAQDEWLVQHSKAQAALRQHEAFDASCQRLVEVLKKGERLRPGSVSREALEAFSDVLSSTGEAAILAVHDRLKALVTDIDDAALQFISTHPADACNALKSLIDAALSTAVTLSVEHAVPCLGVPGGIGVLTVTGETVFLSQCLPAIDATLASHAQSDIKEVRIVAENLYVDTDITLHGTNLLLGAARVEWMTKRTGNATFAPITIDLSGRDDVTVPPTRQKAASGSTPSAFGANGTDGDTGACGQDGKDGEHGGDLLVHCTQACVGLAKDQVAAINLRGGSGGAGGDGGDGGDAGAGMHGANAEQCNDILVPLGWLQAPFHTKYFGQRGGVAGIAGMGGARGFGGDGGRSGAMIVQLRGAAAPISDETRAALVIAGHGTRGQNGQLGSGGQGASGGEDGYDWVFARDSWFGEDSTKNRKGYGLHARGDANRIENWHEAEGGRAGTAIRGRSKARTGEHILRGEAPRRQRTKAQVDTAAFATQVQTHLAYASQENRRDACADLTDTLALARETADALQASGAELNTVLEEIDALRETTTAMVAQQQQQQRASAEAHHVARGPTAIPRPTPPKVRIGYDDAPPPRVADALLQLVDSPVPHPPGLPLVVHAVEFTIDAVNQTHGADPLAVDALMRALGSYLADAPELPKFAQARNLLMQLTEVVASAPLASWIPEFAQVRAGLAILREGADKWPETLSKVMARLHDAIADKERLVNGARERFEKARRISDAIIAATRREQRVRGALYRALATDHLLRSVLAADASVPTRHKKREWLVTRLQQKVTRMPATDAADVAWVAPLVNNLLDAAQQQPPQNAHAVSELIATQMQRLEAELEVEKAALTAQERHLEHGLLRACAHWACQNQPLPASFEAMDLQCIVHALHTVGIAVAKAEAAARQAEFTALEQRRATERAHSRVEALTEQLCAKLSEERLRRHLERQVETLRPWISQDPTLAKSVISAFTEVYASADGPDKALLPLAGEVATALLVLSDTQVRALHEQIVAASTPSEQAPAVALLQALMRNNPAAMHRRLMALQSKFEIADLKTTAAEFLQARCLFATAQAIADWHIATLTSAQAALPTREQALQTWLPRVQRWFDHAALLPNLDFATEVAHRLPAITTNTAASVQEQADDVVDRALSAAVLPPATQGKTDTPALVAYLESVFATDAESALSEGAKAALFLLLTRDVSRTVTTQMAGLLRGRVALALADLPDVDEATVDADPHLSLLMFVHSAWLNRLSDELFDLRQSWRDARDLAHYKLALVRKQEALNRLVAAAEIKALLAFIDQGQAHLDAQAQAEILAHAVDATRVGMTRLQASLGDVKRQLLKRIGAVHVADGWDPVLADAYNVRLGARACFKICEISEISETVGPDSAETFVQLVEKLPASLPTGADLSRLGLALLVGAKELNLNRSQQERLFTQLYPRQDALPAAAACLDILQAEWIEAIHGVAKAYDQEQASRRANLFDQQQAFMTRITELMDAAEVPHRDSYLARTHLFVALLERHFVTSGADFLDGAQRQRIYTDAVKQAETLLAGLENDAAFCAFVAYLNAELHKRVIPSAFAADPKAYFAHLLEHLTSSNGKNLDPSTVERVIDKLEAVAWRGVLDYHAETGDCAVTLLQARLQVVAPHLDVSDDAYFRLARCIKLKFAESLIHSDAAAAREVAQAHLAGDRAVVATAFENAYAWLATAVTQPNLLPTLAALLAQLQAVCKNPRLPLPEWTTTVSEPVCNQSALARDIVSDPAAFDAWMRRLLACKNNLNVEVWESEVIPTCAEHVATYGSASPVDTDAAQDAVDAEALSVRLAAMSALLAKPHPVGPLSQTANRQLACIREQIAGLQNRIIRREAAAVAQRDRAIAGIVAHASATDPQATTALNRALDAAAAYFGDADFCEIATIIDQLLQKKDVTLTCATLTQLWLALPDSADLMVWQSVLENTLPEHWAVGLRINQCTVTMREALAMAASAHADKSLQPEPNEGPDRYCDRLIALHSDVLTQGMADWTAWLITMRQTPSLDADALAYVLGLMARKLTHFSATKTPFPRDAFQSFADDVGDADVLRLLQRELRRPDSLIIAGFRDVSFEHNQYVIRQAWIVAKLDTAMAGLPADEKSRLVAQLLELAATRQKARMQAVVYALQTGQGLTSDAVDAVAGFVDGSFELDDAALIILRGRNDDPAWLRKLSDHTYKQRSYLRTAPDLARLMAIEGEGVNRAVAAWVTTGPDGRSKLEQALAAVQAALHDPILGKGIAIASWGPRRITEWVDEKLELPDGSWSYVHRGPQLWASPDSLHEAMAVLCRSIKLVKDYWPRDTQLATIYLTIRDGVAAHRPGKLAQVATGEGKSLITAGIAILKALGGQQVDVITTSRVLAARDAAANASLYGLFNLTVSNNCDDACEFGEGERSAEAIRRERYFTNDRPVDIVYGEVSAFERDQLLTEFNPHHVDQQVIHSRRRDKASRCALVDEVDGLLLDNASMVLYLSHEIESLRPLEHLFVRIWDLVNAVSLPPDSLGNDAVLAALSQAIRQKIAAGEIRLPGYGVPNAPYVEIQGVIDRRLHDWIRSALYARILRLNHEYIVMGGKKPAVVVVDKSTGVEQASVKWSHGLHQFLQLKHGLEVSPESLKAVFLSNLFFFKQYGNQLFGLSGTLGSETEQECLTKLFGVELFKMPRAYGEKYVQKAPVVTSDLSSWADAILSEAIAQRDKRRATLIVCDTIDDVLSLEKHLKETFPVLHMYVSAHQQLEFLDPAQPRLVQPGDVIIATNLAGRGTDFKTSPELEQAGGLHVILSYLPSNVRVQEQAFGRTARSGNKGTGQFIICEPTRTPIDDLCRSRDVAEKQRLERVLERDVRRIEFEHDLLMGFEHNNERIGGFAELLQDVTDHMRKTGHPPYYATAQIDSLKNRWANWLDFVSAKLDLVHVIGRDTVVAAYKAFERGVKEDLQKRWEALIVEPAEWMKLAAAYRRDQRWHEAEQCYECAARDPEYAVARYYKAACRLIHTPVNEVGAKKAFRSEAKAAARGIERKLRIFQESAEAVARLASQTRLRGDQDFGTPYQARATEKLQVWHIFLSSISDMVGDDLSLEGLNASPHIKDKAHAQAIIDTFVAAGLAKPARWSKKFRMENARFNRQQEGIVDSDACISVGSQLAEVLSPVYSQTGSASMRAVTQAGLTAAMQALMTRERARAALNNKATIVSRARSVPIDDFWEGWEDKAYTQTRRALAKRYAQARRNAQPDDTPEIFKERFLKPDNAADSLDIKHCEAFFEFLKAQHIVTDDYELHFATLVHDSDDYADANEAAAAIQNKFVDLDASLVQALTLALIERYEPDTPSGDDPLDSTPAVRYRVRRRIFLSELALPESVEMAAKNLWGMLETKRVIKPAKLAIPSGRTVEVQMEQIKQVLRQGGALRGDDINIAVDAVADILESTLGMLRTLDDKKITVKFAEIARVHFLDIAQQVPPALREFVEAGLDVVASLIEKKDPPAWYETTALIVMGVAQIVAGVLIKEFVPVAGELIGNTLINTGLDDIIFGISSHIKGEFAWSDYWEAKKDSMVSAALGAAFVSVASFAGSAVQDGLGRAWEFQQTSHIERLKDVSPVFGQATFNVVPHIAREVGRTLVNAGISQVASRGAQSIVGVFADASANALKNNVQEAVARKWPAVAEQAHALHETLQGDPNVAAVIGQCIQEVLRAASQEQAFASLVRTSRPAVSIAASSVPHNGWSAVIEASGDLANLGVSVHRMSTLVETEVEALARAVGGAAATKAASEFAREPMTRETLDAMLDKKQGEFADALIDIINGLLRNAVFSPLLSYGTQYATADIVASLFPRSEIEHAAASAGFMAKVRERRANTDEAHYDDVLRDARGANVEIDLEALPPDVRAELRERTVEGTGQTMGELEAAYKDCTLRFYFDAQHNLYVQRPGRKGYSAAITRNKPAGEPEIIAEARLQNRPITLTDQTDGTVKTYHPDGHIDDATPAHAIRLVYIPGEHGRLAHITAASAGTIALNVSTAFNTDCFYTAVIQETQASMSVAEARKRVAESLLNDEVCQRFYHNWSLDGRVKEFAGEYAGGGIYSRAMGSDREQLEFWAEQGDALKFVLKELYAEAKANPCDFLTDHIWGVSEAKDAHSVICGENIITGKLYTDEERTEIGITAILGTIVPKGLAKGSKYYQKYVKRFGRRKNYASIYATLKEHPELLATMKRPRFRSLQDKELAQWLDKEFWRQTSNIGNGSTAAAVRYEAKTGLSVAGRLHRQKAEGGVNHLERWLRNNPNAPKRDRELVEAILEDTRNALNGR